MLTQNCQRRPTRKKTPNGGQTIAPIISIISDVCGSVMLLLGRLGTFVRLSFLILDFSKASKAFKACWADLRRKSKLGSVRECNHLTILSDKLTLFLNSSLPSFWGN